MSKIVFIDREKTAQSHSTEYNKKSTCNVTFTERGRTKEQDLHVTLHKFIRNQVWVTKVRSWMIVDLCDINYDCTHLILNAEAIICYSKWLMVCDWLYRYHCSIYTTSKNQLIQWYVSIWRDFMWKSNKTREREYEFYEQYLFLMFQLIYSKSNTGIIILILWPHYNGYLVVVL